MTLALLPLCMLHISCISISSDPSRWSFTALHLAHWGCSLQLTIQNTCSLGKGHMASTHSTPASTAAYLGLQQTLVIDGKPPTLIRLHEALVQKLNKAEGGFSPKSKQLISGASNTRLKILRKRKKLEIFIWVHCFSKQQGQTSSKFMGFLFEWKSQHFLIHEALRPQ